MTTDKILPLRKTHPNMFRNLLVWDLYTLAISGLLLLGKAHLLIPDAVLAQPQGIPLEFWGVVYLLIGLALLYGIMTAKGRHNWARRAMVAAAFVGGFWAFGFWSLYFQGLTPLLTAPLLWTLYTAKMMIWASEPTFNPIASAIMKRKGRND